MSNFKGGVHMDDKKYLRISAGKHRGKRVATLVAEAMLGRELSKTEDVHHIDGDGLNCDRSNLQVIDHAIHGWVSQKQGQFMRRKEAHEKAQWESYYGEGSTDFNPSVLQKSTE